jgi:predicted hydrolase (HD superfamily)
MFTNEYKFNETITTIMDETAQHEDVHLIITDDEVIIRQWDNDQEKYKIVCMNHKMFFELQESLKKPEGMYYLHITNKNNLSKKNVSIRKRI